MTTLVLLLVAVVAEVTGTLALRASQGLRRPRWVAAMVLAYLVAFGCLGLVLRRGLEVGVAYGVWAALGTVLTAAAGWALFGERLGRVTLLGLGLVVAGVLLVEVGA